VNECDIFTAALELESPHERRAFLDEACGGDAELRARIELLLCSHAESGDLLENPPTAVAAIKASTDCQGITETAGSRTIPEVQDFLLGYLDPTELPGSLGRIGQYEVLELVGRGGMGIVLKAQDARLNRIVALKVLAPVLAANATARKRFLREARAAAAISHDHVVTIYAVEEGNHTGPDGDPKAVSLPYLVMEFIDGQSLQQKIDREGALELKEILRIGRQTADGLAAAHAQGLIHRDVKPANILLRNGIERVQITDFGLARAVDDVGTTKTGEVTGTPEYMSPEQAQAHPVDARSDLFSLGCVLYAMCTGRSPFRADTMMGSLRRVCDEKPRPIREVHPDAPNWLVAIVDRLLEKTPDDRYQTAAEVSELLGNHLAHLQDPRSKPFPGVVSRETRRMPRAWSRHPWWVAAGVSLVVIAATLGMTEATGVTQFSSTVVRVVTGEGTLIIEIDDPDVQVSLDGEELSISGAGLKEIKLRPGQYQFRATKDGEPLKTELVSITRGDRRIVRVTHEQTDATSPLAADYDTTAATDNPSVPTLPQPGDYEVRRFAGHTAGVDGVCVSADGKRILSASDDGTLRLWDLATGAELEQFVGHSDRVHAAAFLPDGQHVVSGSWDRTVRIWDINSGKEIKRLHGHHGPVERLAVLPDGNRVASASWDKTVIIWNVERGEKLSTLNLDQPVYSVAALPDGQHLLCGCRDGSLQLWNVDDASRVRDFEGHIDQVKALAVSPDGRRALSAGGPDGSFRLWDLEKAEEIRKYSCIGGWANSVAFSPDGHLAALGSGVMEVWDLDADRLLRTCRGDFAFAGAAFVPDGQQIVSACWGDPQHSSVRLWELPEGVWPEDALQKRLADLSKAIETGKNDPQLSIRRARIYGCLREYDKALQDFHTALDLIPEAEATPQRMAICAELSQWDQPCFERLVEMRPGDINLWRENGITMADLGNWDEAARCFKTRLELGPDGAGAWATYAMVLLAQGDDGGYRRLCQTMIEQFPLDAPPSELRFVTNSCLILPDAVKNEEQILQMCRMVWAEPRVQPVANRYLAACMYRCGRLQEAVDLFHQDLWESDFDSNGRYLTCPYAMALHRLGRVEEARQIRQRVVDWREAQGDGFSWHWRIPADRMIEEMNFVLQSPPDMTDTIDPDDKAPVALPESKAGD